MNIVNFEDGVKIQEAYIEIEGKKYNVNPAVYSGKTPLSALNLNKAQKNLLTSTYYLKINADTTEGQEINNGTTLLNYINKNKEKILIKK